MVEPGAKRRHAAPWVLTLLSGAAWAMSMPPWGLWPLSFLVVPLFGAALVVGEARGLRAFLLGFAGTTTAFLAIIPWAANIQPGGLIAWPLLSSIEGIYLGLFAWLISPVLDRKWVGGAALGAGWMGAEIVRGGFPEQGFGWAQFAYAHVDGSWLKPMARIGGGHLITLFVALIGAALFESWRQGRTAVGDLPGTHWERFVASLPHRQPALFVVAGLLFASVLVTVEPPATDGVLDVLVVQGNDFEQTTRFGLDLDEAIAESHLALTQAEVDRNGVPDVTVWPESSIDSDPYLPATTELLSTMRAGAELTEGRLVAGITRVGPSDDFFRNTVSLVGTDGLPTTTYDKRNLVPFGEYVPGRGLFGGIGPLQAIEQDGVRGTNPTHLPIVIDDRRVDLAIAICFETLFAHTVRDNVRGESGDPLAGIIIATTNDASFGRGSEPAQHLAQSKLRAVETGRWVVHAAISGSSAFVDPNGVVHQATDLFTATSIRMDVPVAVGSTPYLSAGDLVGKLGLVALAAIAMLRLVEFARRPRRNRLGT